MLSLPTIAQTSGGFAEPEAAIQFVTLSKIDLLPEQVRAKEPEIKVLLSEM
ncbi:MAG: hypothetical protein F6K00_09275 [Leptolyngbya sp. SIOISBB]|nr:hypothetical protein [Leptolyngbya sp. SIOISBB]